MNEDIKILSSDLKEPEGDAAKVLSALNDYIERQTDNRMVTSKNIVECVVSAALLPLLVNSPVRNPRAVIICRATTSTGAAAGVALNLDWSYQNDQIVISAMYGMAAGSQYKLSLLVV